MHALDIFVVVSGSFSIVATLPLVALALRSVRADRDHAQRRATCDLAETKQTVERVAAATSRRRLPRIRLELSPE